MELFSQNYAVLVPAYGRDYKNKAEVLKDFDAQKDFILQNFNGSTFINKQQIKEGTKVQIRYKKLQSVMIVEVKGK